MKLTVFSREVTTKGAIKAIRRKGDIPGIIYSKGKPGEVIAISGDEFSAIMRDLKAGHLPTTIFTLSDGKKERRVIIKEIQYHPTTYRPVHVDFEELKDGVSVNVKVPIQCIGLAECVGIKLGGFLRQVKRHVKVECKPKDIPTEFIVDVKDLDIRQSKRLSDLDLPKGVKLLAPATDVVAVIGKKAGV